MRIADFCKLGIEDRIPDHSVFCRARNERFRESDALRRVFEGVVAMCIEAGLVGGEAFSIDASLIKADVNKTKRIPGDQPFSWPKAEEASHAVREYLVALDAARGQEDRGGDDGSGEGSQRRKPPKEVSLTDPQATWVARPGLDPFFAYDANYLIDNKAGIIIDAAGSRANRAVEIAVTQTMVERVERRFDLRPRRLAGDTAYGAVRLLKWLVDRNIAPLSCLSARALEEFRVVGNVVIAALVLRGTTAQLFRCPVSQTAKEHDHGSRTCKGRCRQGKRRHQRRCG